MIGTPRTYKMRHSSRLAQPLQSHIRKAAKLLNHVGLLDHIHPSYQASGYTIVNWVFQAHRHRAAFPRYPSLDLRESMDQWINGKDWQLIFTQNQIE